MNDAYRFSVRDSTEFRVNADPFVITLTPNSEFDLNGTMDKTAIEITNAYLEGRQIIARIPDFSGLDLTELHMVAMTKALNNDCICVHFEVVNLLGGASVLLKVCTGTSSDDDTSYDAWIFPLTEFEPAPEPSES